MAAVSVLRHKQITMEKQKPKSGIVRREKLAGDRSFDEVCTVMLLLSLLHQPNAHILEVDQKLSEENSVGQGGRPQ